MMYIINIIISIQYHNLFENKKKTKRGSESDDEEEKTITFENSELKSDFSPKVKTQETSLAFKEFTFQEKENNSPLKGNKVVLIIKYRGHQ